jgi:hypothetical protein
MTADTKNIEVKIMGVTVGFADSYDVLDDDSDLYVWFVPMSGVGCPLKGHLVIDRTNGKWEHFDSDEATAPTSTGIMYFAAKDVVQFIDNH